MARRLGARRGGEGEENDLQSFGLARFGWEICWQPLSLRVSPPSGVTAWGVIMVRVKS